MFSETLASGRLDIISCGNVDRNKLIKELKDRPNLRVVIKTGYDIKEVQDVYVEKLDSFDGISPVLVIEAESFLPRL